MATKKTRPALKGEVTVGATRLRESRSRSSTTWTVGLLRAAEQRADRGDLSLMGEAVDTMLGDDRIPGVARSRAQSLLGLTVYFDASGDGRRKGRAVRALEADEDWWELAPEEELARLLTYGVIAGIAPAVLMYEDEDGRGKPRYLNGRLVPRLNVWSPRGLQRTTDDDGWTMLLADSSRVPFVPGDGQWIAYTPYGVRRPWLHGAWRGLARWWLLKQYAIDDWGRYGEKGASTLVTSDKDTHVTRELRQDLANSVYELARDGVIVLPAGFDLRLIEATANTTQLYGAQIEAANSAFAVSLLGHANNAEVHGANTGSTAGETIRHELRAFDGQTLSTCMRQQALVHWAEQNFGSADLAPWPVYPTAPERDAKLGAETLKALGDGIAAVVAVDSGVDVRAILEEYKVPISADAAPYAPPTQQPHTAPAAGPPADAATSRAALASGGTSTPFVEGLEYVDALVAGASGRGTEALQPTVAAVAQAIEEAETPEGLKAALLSLVASNPGFERLVAEAMVMADLNGRFRVASE